MIRLSRGCLIDVVSASVRLYQKKDSCVLVRIFEGENVEKRKRKKRFDKWSEENLLILLTVTIYLFYLPDYFFPLFPRIYLTEIIKSCLKNHANRKKYDDSEQKEFLQRVRRRSS